MNARFRKLLQITITILTFCFCLLILPSAASCDVIIFSDDFEEGNADNWEIIEFGEWAVIDGQYCLQTV